MSGDMTAVEFLDQEIELAERELNRLKAMRDRAEDSNGAEAPAEPKKRRGRPPKSGKKPGKKKRGRPKGSGKKSGGGLAEAIMGALPTDKNEALSPAEIFGELEEAGYDFKKPSAYQTLNRLKKEGQIKSKKGDGRGNVYWAKAATKKKKKRGRKK